VLYINDLVSNDVDAMLVNWFDVRSIPHNVASVTAAITLNTTDLFDAAVDEYIGRDAEEERSKPSFSPE